MTVQNAAASDIDESVLPSMRWKWFPLLWIGLLLSIWLYLWMYMADPALSNTFAHGAVITGTLGVGLWVLISSGWSRVVRWALGGIPITLVALQYLQLSPVEMVLDGDVGLIGFRWRAEAPDKQMEAPKTEGVASVDWQATPHDYPRFLGNGYWAEVKNVDLATDWQANPPREVWRTKIGAGWSAFSIVGKYAVTQEQRGEDELVTCYSIETGDIIWSHADPVRWDPGGTGALGYAGPRATPTIHEGKVFALGATGIINCLDASSGTVIWSHDTLQKHDASNVNWGKAGSPLIVDDLVVVSVGGKQDQSMVAYKIGTGEVVWTAGEYQSSYASPVLAEFAGVRQIVSVDEGYVTSRRVEDGKSLWEFEWPSSSGADAASSQPIPLPNDQLFVSKGYGLGATLRQVTNAEQSGWQVEPTWRGVRQYGEKPILKTKMGNVVVHDGYVYGLDDIYLQCVELETGKKKWKKRRKPKFGHGQIMLIGDVILILSEFGEVVLAAASPDGYEELASMRVFKESQITWNNPAFSFPYLLVRNAEEAACYELPGKEILEVAGKN